MSECRWCGVERDAPAAGPHACDPQRVWTRGGGDARALALHMAEWIVQQPSGLDHACSRCLPDGEIVVPGFMCARHVARGLMAAAGKCVDCAKVATHQKCARGPESGHPWGTPLCETHACPQCTPITAGATRT